MTENDFELDIQLSSEETEEQDANIPDAYTWGNTCTGHYLCTTEPCECGALPPNN
ncbi:hypothetical protein [Ktedonosporobacter rubrisoli]|uniref:hypothetical protein n=1 Tax=Ktedonosporobacter rubrisoli TaxID=2509675 RepID=UPI0013EE688A|nr:hypothetical protein [Ktedonosporobacter rubrisoli]